MRILFTGGSGKAGKHVVPYLLEQGHRVVNVDLTPLDHPGVDNLTADITDSGQMFNVMSSYANFDELEPGTGVPKFDAVVHFAAVPRILIRPDNETFRVNTVGTYNVIEAAVKLGIRKIIIASSETTYGVCFADGEVNPASLPVEEDMDVNPMDSYGLSKVVNEQTARSFSGAPASTSTRSHRQCRWSRTNMTGSRGFFADPEMSAAATSSAISTRAISARSSIAASRRTGSVSRSSMPATTPTRSTFRPLRSPSGSSPACRDPRDGRERSAVTQTARSARCSASRKNTTGANM
jgi:nucleoside-diphosphate-sugar epimerase